MILQKIFYQTISKLDLNRTVKFVKQLFRIQIGERVLLWTQAKSRMEACYSELVLRAYCPNLYTVLVGSTCPFFQAVMLMLLLLLLLLSVCSIKYHFSACVQILNLVV